MDHKKRNWLIAALIAAAVLIILLLVYWNNTKDKGSATKNTETTELQADSAQTEELPASEAVTDNTEAAADDTASLQNYIAEQDEIMAQMMTDMDNVTATGNASVHFLKGMTPHHESAVKMAESYLKYGGKNDALKRIAESVIDTQTKEIDDMSELIRKIEESGQTDKDKESGYLGEYEKMMQSHQHSGHSGHNAPANVEYAFAEGMIMHHQMAVEMAQAILKYTDDEDVKTLAQNIIDAQEKEIKEMQDIMAE